jgi:predicted P-loop ATPase
MEDEEAKVILGERLEIDKNGNLTRSLRNAEAILNYDPELRGVFAYDLFSEMPVLKRTPSWRSFDIRTESEDCKNVQTYDEMTDTDESYLRLYFEEKYNFDARAVLTDALNITEHKNAFHPVRDYLNSLVWDGVPRLEKIFVDCFGVEDSLYAREVGLKFFVGAVRRVFIPAAKMDYIPVLVSEEGLGKSKFVRRMAKLWGSDTFYTFNGSKEAYEQLRGVWIMEIPELNGVQSKSANGRKAFVTKGEDRYRSAYLKYTKTYKRQCVFIASSNDVIFLDDPSEDGRRWWGLMCNKDRIKVSVHDDEFLERVDMYWAEAVHYYLQGVLPILSDAAEHEARSLRQTHKAEDVELGALIEYLEMPVPDNWGEMSVFERRQYWNNPKTQWTGKKRDYVCTPEVAREFYEFERGDLGVKVGRKVADAIRRTELFVQTGQKKKFGEYGSALAWVRKTTLGKERK